MTIVTKYINASKALIGWSTLLAMALAGCEKQAIQQVEKKNWELVWSDEFEGTAGASPDATKWTFDIGAGGWGNQELQFYTNRPSNVSLDGLGNLVLTARNESFSGAPFTSARIKTQGKFAQTYGRFEARLKTPYGPGMWPAFWMLGSNINTVPWPQCGEIDIMEQRGQEPNINNGSIHGPGYSGGASITKKYRLPTGRFDTDFYLYAVEWGTDYIDFYVNDYLYQRIEASDLPGEWVFNQPFFMIMNIAVGGNYVGFPTAGTIYPQTMTVDYVRVYKEKMP
jgi:beta-glucanase (GH16 family)